MGMIKLLEIKVISPQLANGWSKKITQHQGNLQVTVVYEIWLMKLSHLAS